MQNYSLIENSTWADNQWIGSTTIDPSLNLTTVKSASTQLLLYDILIPTLGILILGTNLAVVVSIVLILRTRVQPKTTYMFLGNVALTDLVAGTAVLLGQFAPKETRTFGICSLQIGMIVSSTLASVWSVGLIAIDRFLYILQGMKYQRLLYPKRAQILILCTWILGLIIGFLPAMGWTGDKNSGKICWYIRLAPSGLIILTTILGVIPILIVIILYSIILYHALKKVIQLKKADKASKSGISHNHVYESPDNIRVFRGTGNKDGQQPSSPKKWKAIKVVIFTSGSFVCTWMPYFIACTLFVFCTNADSCKALRVAIAAPLAILGFLNSLLNPIIYAWWHKGFRQSAKKLVAKVLPKKKEQTNTRITSDKFSKSISSSKTKSTQLSGRSVSSDISQDAANLKEPSVTNEDTKL